MDFLIYSYSFHPKSTTLHTKIATMLKCIDICFNELYEEFPSNIRGNQVIIHDNLQKKVHILYNQLLQSKFATLKRKLQTYWSLYANDSDKPIHAVQNEIH